MSGETVVGSRLTVFGQRADCSAGRGGGLVLVEESDGSGEVAVPQSSCSGCYAPVSSSKWQQLERFVVWMGGLCFMML